MYRHLSSVIHGLCHISANKEFLFNKLPPLVRICLQPCQKGKRSLLVYSSKHDLEGNKQVKEDTVQMKAIKSPEVTSPSLPPCCCWGRSFPWTRGSLHRSNCSPSRSDYLTGERNTRFRTREFSVWKESSFILWLKAWSHDKRCGFVMKGWFTWLCTVYI